MKVLIKNANLWQWIGSNSTNPITSIGRYKGKNIPNCWLTLENGWITQVGCDNNEDNICDMISNIIIDTFPSIDLFDQIIDANGQFIIPGLQDSHIHINMLGESRYFLDLKQCKSIIQLQTMLKDHCDKYSIEELSWIQGVNWDQTDLKRYPTRQDLDLVCANRPIFLWRACWHIGVANTIALHKCNINFNEDAIEGECNKDYPIVDGGVIELDTNDYPTGILKERACELVFKLMGNKSIEEKSKFISEGLDLCLKMGLTSVQTNDECSLVMYRTLQANDQLPIRVFLTPNISDLDIDSSDGGLAGVNSFRPVCFNKVPPLDTTTCNSSSSSSNSSSQPYSTLDCSDKEAMLIMERLKIFSDGSLGAETAAISIDNILDGNFEELKDINIELHNDHTTISNTKNTTDTTVIKETKHDNGDASNYNGVLYHTPANMASLIESAIKRGYRLEIHAIGDAAADEVLTAFEVNNICKNDRAIITHCQVLRIDLIDRMFHLGIIANIQPSFVPTDMKWVKNRLTDAKQLFSYAWKTLLDRGVMCAGGSDAPIETCSPFVGMYDAIHRTSRDDIGVIFRQEERLDLSDALWIYTIGAAYASGCEHILGQLTKGYIGDMVFVNPAVINDNSLLACTLPSLVMVGGKIAYINDSMTDKVCKKNNISNIIITTTSNNNDVSNNDNLITMKGPYIPGKGGPRLNTDTIFSSLSTIQNTNNAVNVSDSFITECSCRILGRMCSKITKKQVKINKFNSNEYCLPTTLHNDL